MNKQTNKKGKWKKKLSRSKIIKIENNPSGNKITQVRTQISQLKFFTQNTTIFFFTQQPFYFDCGDYHVEKLYL